MCVVFQQQKSTAIDVYSCYEDDTEENFISAFTKADFWIFIQGQACVFLRKRTCTCDVLFWSHYLPRKLCSKLLLNSKY